MTAKQSAFIARLVSEKTLPVDSTDPNISRKTGYVLALSAGRASVVPDVEAASRIIQWLLALPNRDAQASAASTQTVAVESGRYALVDADGSVKFYRVDRPTEGKWAGWTFVKAQASDDEWAIRNSAEKTRILSAIAADPHAAMIRYGHEIGCCGRCGRTLTDEDSRAAGIGPECAKILGIDRTGASEAAKAARRAEVDGVGAVDETAAQDALAAMGVYDGQDVLAETGDVDLADFQPSTDDPVDDPSTGLDEDVARRADPAKRLTWRERAAAVADQQRGANVRKAARRVYAIDGDGMEIPY